MTYFARMLVCIFFIAPLAGAQQAVRVVSVLPSGTTQEVHEAQRIVVTFNQPMVALASPREKATTSGPFTVDPPIAGTFRWLGTSTVELRPAAPLPLATKFTVTVAADIKAVSGGVLAQPYTWSFETPRPRIIGTLPANGTRWVRTDSHIFFRFNQAVDAAAVTKFFSMGTAVKTKTHEIVDPIPFRLRQATPEDLAESGRLGDSPDSVVALVPLVPLPLGQRIVVTARRGLPAKSGPLGLAAEYVLRFSTVNLFGFTGWDPRQPTSPVADITLYFTNPVSHADLVQHLRFAPEVTIPEYYSNWTWSDADPTLSLYLPPDTTLSFTIDADMPDRYGSKLGKAASGKITTTDYPPRVRFTTGPGIIEADGEKRVPIETLNYPSLPVGMKKLSADELIPLLSEEGIFYDQQPASLILPVHKTLSFGRAKNKWMLRPLELKDALAEDSTGVVFAQLDATTADGKSYRKGLYQITHLGLTGKFSPANNLIFVTRMRDAAPVGGAQVEVRNDRSEILWTGATDIDGRCETPGWAALGVEPVNPWEPPRLWIFVYKNSDFAFLHSEWGTGIYPYRFGIDYEWNPQPLVRTGALMTDRGLYRAGEVVYFKGIVREKDSRGQWRVPIQRRWRWRVEDSRNQEAMSKIIALSDYGAFDDSVRLDEAAALGLYWMSLGAPTAEKTQRREEGVAEGGSPVATGSFRVEAFRPAEFAVTALATNVADTRRGYIAGDSVNAKISGRYLFGAPMRHSPVKWRLQLLPSDFSSKRFTDYTFRQWRSWSERADYHGSRLLAAGTDSLDSAGEIALAGTLIEPGVATPQQLLIEGEVTSPSGQALSGRTAVPVHPAEFYIGLRTSGYFFPVNKVVACSVVAVTADDRVASGRPISLRTVQRQWHSVRKAGVGGRYSWETSVEDTPVDSSTITSTARTVAHLFTPKKSGYYLIEARATDSRGNATRSALFFYVSGADYVAWERSDDDRIELVADRRVYKPGDIATVMIQSPFEKCRALVTIERESIFESRVMELVGTAPTIAVPIKEDYLPNVFLSVALLHGRTGDQQFSPEGQDLGRPQFKIGYTNLTVDPGTRHLAVTVKSDRPDYRPGETVYIDVDVSSVSGVGVESEVAIAVVDAGVLNLIAYTLPDPFGDFYGPRPLSVRTSETLLHLVEQRNYGEKAEPTGGGGSLFSSIEVRADFKMTPLWLPSLRTNARGHAEARFRLPGNLTTFRIMAVAHTRDSRFGGGSSEFRVNKPLLMQAAAPRFNRSGDRFAAGVVVTNNTAQPGKVSLQLLARGVRALGDSLASFELAPGESRAVRLPFFSERLGKAVYQCRARMKVGQEIFTDGLEFHIPVMAPQTKEVVATSGSTEGQAQESLQVPGEIYLDAGTVELTASATALAGLRESVSYLFEYPYGCLEQRLSRVLPMVIASDLVDAFELSALANVDYREVVRQSLSELARYQNSDGSFSLWAGGSSAGWDYVSALALYTLVRAQQNQYAVDAKILEPAKKYATEQLRIEYNARRSEGERSFYYTRALFVHALALLGERPNDYLTFLFEQRRKMSLDGQSHLLRAAALMQKRALVKTMQAELGNKVKVAPTTAHFEDTNPEELWWCYYSTARTTALCLQALIETRALFSHADKVVRWLLDERRLGRWRTTQENSTVFEALATYFRNYERDIPDFTAEIRIAGKRYLEEIFSGRTTEVRRATAPLRRFAANRDVPVHVQKSGAGRFYYGLRMTYFPLQPSPSLDQGLAIEKEMRRLAGGDGPTSTYNSGDVVQIILRVITPQERHFVVVDDPLPAGLEAIDPRLLTTSSEYQEYEQQEEPSWWRTGWDHVEKHDDRVLLFANWLPAGEHVYRYLARATTAGTFTMPSTRAEEMYTPEVFGVFQGGAIEIK